MAIKGHCLNFAYILHIKAIQSKYCSKIKLFDGNFAY